MEMQSIGVEVYRIDAKGNEAILYNVCLLIVLAWYSEKDDLFIAVLLFYLNGKSIDLILYHDKLKATWKI